MTTSRLTPDGDMHLSPRAWAESLCTPLPDGTWLVQAPIREREEPRLYLLPDMVAKERYLTRATSLIRRRVADRLLELPFAIVQTSLITVLITGITDSSLLLWIILVTVPGFLAWLLIANLLPLRRVFGWLSEHGVRSPSESTRPPVLVRTAMEWEGFYRAAGLRRERKAAIIAMSMVAIVHLWILAFYLNACRGVSALDGMVPRMPGWRREYYVVEGHFYMFCAVNGWMLVAYGAVTGLVIYAAWRRARRYRAGRASAIAAPG